MANHRYNSTYEKLLAEGYKPEMPYGVNNRYEASEDGSTYKLENITAPSVAFPIDGGIIQDTTTKKCDKLILIRTDNNEVDSEEQQWLQLFIELKGSKLKKALEQILCTIENPIFANDPNSYSNKATKCFAYVASRRYPETSNLRPEATKIKIKLAAKGIEVRIKSTENYLDISHSVSTLSNQP